MFGIDKFKQDDFAEYTGKYVNKPMALALNDEVWSAPTSSTSCASRSRSATRGLLRQRADVPGQLPHVGQPAAQAAIRAAGGDRPGARRGRDQARRDRVDHQRRVIILFMLWYYRFSGLVANAALMLNVFFILTVMVLFEATLSLPAIAGIILSLGVAVDANILVFERTREELAEGQAAAPRPRQAATTAPSRRSSTAT